MLYHQEGPLKYQKWSRKNHKTYPKNTRKNEVVFLTTWLSSYFLTERSIFWKLRTKNDENQSIALENLRIFSSENCHYAQRASLMKKCQKWPTNKIFGVIFGGYERYIFFVDMLIRFVIYLVVMKAIWRGFEVFNYMAWAVTSESPLSDNTVQPNPVYA